jgi:formylglycine-generating enzyme required for sulfatase activity
MQTVVAQLFELRFFVNVKRHRLLFVLTAFAIYFLTFFAALTPNLVQAQTKRVAFLVGNANYQGESVLRNPINDVQLLARVFRDDLKFTEVIERRDLNRAQLYDLVQEIASRGRNADSVVVYFSGHGMRGLGGNFLIPIDARISSDEHLRRDAISATDLTDALQSTNARVALLVLDACRDNPYARRTKSASKGLARMNVSGGNLLVAYATRDGDVAKDGDGANSPYAIALAQQLKLTNQSVLVQLDQVRRSVMQQTSNAQSPTREGDLEAHVMLASVQVEPTPVRPVRDIDQEAYDLARVSNSVGGFEAYLREYPQGRFVTAARVALAALKPSEPSPRPSPAVSPLQSGSSALSGEMVLLPSGVFTMGSGASEADRGNDEGPQRQVRVERFELGKYEVTQGQWLAVMGSNPSHFKACGSDCPVEQVNWDEVQGFIKRLNERTGLVYRLPSESEWEYGCRAGEQQRYCGSNEVESVALYRQNSGIKTQRVGQKRANAWGIHDMSGNVWEWTQDCWNDSYANAPVTGAARTDGNCVRRVLRGGSWNVNARFVRAAYRSNNVPATRFNDIGFRLARTLP